METARKPPVLPLEISEEFESKRSAEERIITALRDDCTNTIGIFGVRGVGKTRLASRIGDKVKREKLFEVVMMLRVGPRPNLERMAYEIFDYLGVRFAEGDVVAQATELLSKIVIQSRVLIILDDVWAFLDEGISGIPKGSCKIVIVSRFKEVCLEMGCNVIFKLIADDISRDKSGSSTGSDSKSSARFLGRKETKFPPRGSIKKNIFSSTVRNLGRILGAGSSHEVKLLEVGPSTAEQFITGAGSSQEMKVMEVLPSTAEQFVTGAGSSQEMKAIDFEDRVEQFIAKFNSSIEVQKKAMDTKLQEILDSPSITLQGSDVRSGGFQVVPGEMKMLRNLSTLLVLDLRDSDIQELPRELKNLTNLRLLNLTNCRNLQIIEYGLISSFVRMEELYMLGSFNAWEVEKGGENASINELEFLLNLTALQIQIRDPSVIRKSSRIWSRLTSYVISTPEELKCRYKESSHVSFPAVEYCWQFERAIIDLPSATYLIDWVCVILRSAEYLCLNGDGSKSAVDELIVDGFKLLKQLHIGGCNTMEYLVDGVPTNGLFPSLESLRLDDLPLFKKMFNSQVPGLLMQLSFLKPHGFSTLLDVCRRQTHGFCFLSLRSIHISRCPKLRSLFSLSMAWNLMQLEEMTIESCEMMEEIFSDEGGKIGNRIAFSKLYCLQLHNLPHLTDFCKNTAVDFPQLRDMSFQGLRKLGIFCPADSDLPLEENYNDVQSLFNEKVEFGSLNRLEISKLKSVTSIWCHQTSPSLFSQLEVLVVTSCDTLRHLISHSIAEVLVRLEQLTIEDCLMMQEVIADEGEAGMTQTNESLFPGLRKLKLLRLPMLKSFWHTMNDLELPSLEDLTLNGCQEMQEFSGGKLSMPVLRCVEKDYSEYRIDSVNSIQLLFNDKRLFVHQSYPLPGQYQDQEAEDVMEEDRMGEPILAHLQRSSQASRGIIGANLLYDIEAKNFCSVSNQNIMTEEDVADSPESYLQVLGGRIGDGDATMSSYGTSGRGEIEETNIDVLGNRRYLKDFTFFCSVLPDYYEFTKDVLVWQWMIGGFIESGEDKLMEEVCAECFDTLVGMDYIVPLGYDYIFDQMKYKIGDEVTTFLQKQLMEPKFGKYSDSEWSYTTEVEHMSITLKDINCVKLGVLKQFSRLQTLVIHDWDGVDHQLPSDLFCELETLKILNLSHTNIAVLPSSIENLKELRFFDMSKTPIRWLPETMRWFSHLQTLNLDGCSQLERLPKCTDKLINLRHLILDVRQLQLMPAGIGKLSNLQTLNAFLVGDGDGDGDGCCVSELKDLNKLRGSFRLLNLENVGSKEKASEACLDKKVKLRKIELQWSDFQDEKSPNEEEILESLQPPISIQELKILFYSGGLLPSWISNPSFNELASIILHRCRYFSSLPSLGELQSLESLMIIENNEVVEIDSSFFRKRTNRDRMAFPKLKKLSFDSMSKLEKWTGFEEGDFPSLRCLIIEYCPKLVELPFLSHLNHLLQLEIRYCPELSCLPKDGLPLSLESLMIKQTPKLKAQCCDEQWEDWSKVAHVPAIYIDDQEFSPKNREFVPS